MEERLMLIPPTIILFVTFAGRIMKSGESIRRHQFSWNVHIKLKVTQTIEISGAGTNLSARIPLVVGVDPVQDR